MTGDRVSVREGAGGAGAVPGGAGGLSARPLPPGRGPALPHFFLFCPKEEGRYRVHFTRFADPLILPRKGREAAMASYAERFARALEEEVARAPLQWFNFYHYWA